MFILDIIKIWWNHVAHSQERKHILRETAKFEREMKAQGKRLWSEQ